MSIVRLTPLSLLVLLLALAVIPAIADEKKKDVGEVTFVCKTTGNDNDGYNLIATNNGTTDKECKASCTLTKKGGGKTSGDEKTKLVRAGKTENVYGEAGISGAPLSDPQIDASCR